MFPVASTSTTDGHARSMGTDNAATNDADVRIQLTTELGPLPMVVASGRVIGGRVFLMSLSSCLHAQHPAWLHSFTKLNGCHR